VTAGDPPDPKRRVVIESDGAARGNPGPAGIGAVITTPQGEVLAEIAEGIGVATNNVAEYRAAIAGLERAKELGATDVVLRSDSRLLIEQLSGRFRVKHPTLQRLNQEARKMLAEFPTIRLENVPRERNKAADRLANLGVDEWLLGEGADWTPDPPPARLFESDTDA
jgi:ribonuclease H / adenosylcobalamin/alpha-ribazole phosphatase